MTHIRALLSAAIIAAAISQPIVAKEVRWVDRIVVIVNQDIITERDINDAIGNLKATLPKGQTVNDEELRQAAIEQLIDKKLILQTAKRMDIAATNAEIQSQIEQIAAAQNMSVEKIVSNACQRGCE